MSADYKYISYSQTDVGNQRTNNEDSFGSLQLPDGHLFIVCDGMGAHQAGEHASSMCVRLIKDYFSYNVTGNSSIDLYNAIIFANEQLYIAAKNNADLKGMGTTVVTLLIRKNEIFIGHVGDSRIYLYSSNKLFQLTKDHSFVQNLVDQGIITRKEMETHSRKNELTNAIGIYPEIKPTISNSSIRVKTGDRFLLCTDGLNGMISDLDIKKILSSSDNIEVSCSVLINQAKLSGGLDNITTTLVSITKSPFTNTMHEGLNVLLENSQSNSATKPIYNKLWFQLLLAAIIPLSILFGYGLISGRINLSSDEDVKTIIDDKETQVDAKLIKLSEVDTLDFSKNQKSKLKKFKNESWATIYKKEYKKDNQVFLYDTLNYQDTSILYFRKRKPIKIDEKTANKKNTIKKAILPSQAKKDSLKVKSKNKDTSNQTLSKKNIGKKPSSSPPKDTTNQKK